MDRLPRLSLNNRSFIALVCIVITVIGVLSMTTLRRELIPSISLPVVAVVATNPGASSEQMAEQIADPIERQLRTMEQVDGTSSESRSNFTMITVELNYGADIYRGASQADVLLSRTEEQLPDGTTTQVITGGTGDIPAMIVSVASDVTPEELAERLDASLLPEIGSVDGVATVQLLGAPDEILELDLDDAAMAAAGVTQGDVVSALEDAGLRLPGGTVTDGPVELDITVGNEITSVEDVEAIILLPGSATDGESAGQPPGGSAAAPVSLGEVAAVSRTTAALESISRTDGRDSVTLLVTPAVGANFIEISEDVTALLDESAAGLGNDTAFTVVFDQAPFIEESIEGLATEGGWGLLFALVTIFAFLWSLRPTLIAGVSIPLSLLFAFAGMLVTGTTMNMMSLAGLMLAIGRMVDDSIVVVENIVRHLEQSVKPKFRTIVDAVSEVAGAVISSTIVALLVFLPLVLVSGVAGELFRPFALTTVLALSGSLLVSLTIVPVLAYWFLKRRTSESETEAVDDGAVVSDVAEDATARPSHGWLARLYRPGLAWSIRHRAITVVLAIGIFVGSLALTPLLKVNLLGDSGMNNVMVSQTLPVGTTIEQSLSAAEEFEPRLLGIEGVETVQTSVGGGGFGFATAQANTISYTVVMEPGSDMERAQALVQQAINLNSGSEAGDIEIAQGGGPMMGSNTVDVVLQGLDDEARATASEQVVDALTGLEGSSGVASNLDATTPALDITIRPEDAARFGMSVTQASALIAMQTAEFPVGRLAVDGTDLQVFFTTEGTVETVEDVESLSLGGLPISAIADVERVEVAPSFTTENAVRTVTVSVTPASTDDVGSLGTQVQEAVAALDLPEGVSWEMGGVSADMDEAFGQLGLAMLAAVLLIYVVMVWLFKSLMQPLILLMSIPFAVTGVLIALLVTGNPIGLPALVGLLMLIGIVVTNAIVLIDLINQYRRRGMSLDDAILIGGQNRVRPIIMTAAATITAMLPPALGLASQSSFVSGPMAIAVIGGLIASTLITLIIIPVLYRIFEGWRDRRPHADEDREPAIATSST